MINIANTIQNCTMVKQQNGYVLTIYSYEVVSMVITDESYRLPMS